MLEDSSESMSRTLLENQGIEATKAIKNQEVAALPAITETLSSDLLDEESFTLVERSQIIKAILDQEISIHQWNGLKIEQIDLILTKFLHLESLRPIDQRLSLYEMMEILAEVFKKPYTEDRFQNIVEEVQRLENDPNLKEFIQNDMTSHSMDYWYDLGTDSPAYSEGTYENIMSSELDKLYVREFIGHTEAVMSLALSVDCRFIISGSK